MTSGSVFIGDFLTSCFGLIAPAPIRLDRRRVENFSLPHWQSFASRVRSIESEEENERMKTKTQTTTTITRRIFATGQFLCSLLCIGATCCGPRIHAQA